MDKDEQYMSTALALAQEAFNQGEVPVGAIVVKDEEIIGRGWNLVEQCGDPTAHAETAAIREAALTSGGWRLTGCTLYATKEPCPMCAGAIVLARLDRLVFGAPDEKMGYAVTLNQTVQDARLNPRVEGVRGVLAEESAVLLQKFFGSRRAKPADNI